MLRDHNDVIEFNVCGNVLTRDRVHPMTVDIRRGQCLSPGIDIRKQIYGSNVNYEVRVNLKSIRNLRKLIHVLNLQNARINPLNYSRLGGMDGPSLGFVVIKK